MELDYLLQTPRESLRHRLRKSAVPARRFETFLASLTLLALWRLKNSLVLFPYRQARLRTKATTPVPQADTLARFAYRQVLRTEPWFPGRFRFGALHFWSQFFARSSFRAEPSAVAQATKQRPRRCRRPARASARRPAAARSPSTASPRSARRA